MTRAFVLLFVFVFAGYNGISRTESGISSDTATFAMLYIYRPADELPYHYKLEIAVTNSLIKDVLMGSLKNKSKFAVSLYQEGKTEIYVRPKSGKAVAIDVKFGETYYVKCGVVPSFWGPDMKIELIPPKQGEPEYKQVKRVEK
jgi:hypothetical protein